MWKIIKLDKNLANQIAAWEVVERPLSVVKELVENSIDAWADSIIVEIEKWGIETIIVSDNWVWIEKSDLSIVLDKYTTSKIKTISDLYNVMTFGFRWEALSAIASVSKLKIFSKTKQSRVGYEYSSKDWTKESPLESGTKIIINSLFYNTPARLNYLKSERTEFSHVSEFLNQISLIYPQVWIEFKSDKKTIFKRRAWETAQSRIFSVYSDDFSKNLLDVKFWITWLTIEWFISSPNISFWNRNRQLLSVNRRIIKSPLISKAVYDAYNRYIPHWNFPWYVINIDIDPTQVDVNVHPRKLEVRFSNEQDIFRLVYKAISWKLDSVSIIKPESDSHESKIAPQNSFFVWSWSKFKSYSPYKQVETNPRQSDIDFSLGFTQELLKGEKSYQWDQDLKETKLWRIVWQALNSYIIIETKEGAIQILDQHALAERIIYENLVKNRWKWSSQKLLVPESVSLTPKEADLLHNNISTIKDMGFDFEIMKWSAVINTIPNFVWKESLSELFLWIIDDIWEYFKKKSKKLDEVQNKIFAYTACRSAVKFGNKLSIFEINKLLNDAVLSYSSTCPHWRPVCFEIWLEELKGKYER